MNQSPDATTVWRPGHAVELKATLGLLRRGPRDPCHQHAADGAMWRASRMGSGPVTYRLAQTAPHEIACAAWGPGAAELVEQVPELLGAKDDVSTFAPEHPLVADAHRRHPGLRIMRTTRVLEALIPAVLEQRVIGGEAFGAWRRLVTKYGDPAPGPTPVPMHVPPTAETWRLVPSWEWHRAGVDPQRSATAVRCATLARQLQGTVDLAPADADRRLRAVPGVGIWTAAEVAQRALGDGDSISVGDYHLSDQIGWTFLGRPVDDDEMVELLEPFRPHRGRVVRLLGASRMLVKPRRGPRLSYEDHRKH